ncbi:MULTISPECIES: DUF1349 domain-containing protein [unclassified Aureimonas]|uniref:DUF1349 domain-containing protein n=1 Tax=unclassified Aureimonas TaxID=2615206 RepID=UPI0006FE9723|nr:MULTISPECIES: DUF1349 domain-containing protein [unclassified Aureimonas]KQT64027.1 regulation of enolase 1 [Aureimonas sp. Leaf427]KQT81220.1 regulation of enolase 1 [Aureimonas sp. Leaf460]
MFDACEWLNEPKSWSLGEDGLDVVTDDRTDFWRETHYGFSRHSGHVFGLQRSGPFTASLRVRAAYEHLYDQAGLMVRIDEAHWIKAGIELSDGAACLGSVLTVGQSDWATGPFAGDPTDIFLRVTIGEGVLRLQASGDGTTWPLVRLAPFPRAERYFVGPMCCTPERSGLKVCFSDFKVSAPLGKDLHDLT